MDAMNRRWRGEARVQDELDQAILRRREIYQNSLYAKVRSCEGAPLVSHPLV